MADRTILHSDLNSFYASVEIRNNPTLADKPVAVGGDEQARHGIVLAANPLAKQYGIRTAETLWSARCKCPDLVIVPTHFDEYHRFSQAVRQIYLDYTSQIEPMSLDEAFLDLTGSREPVSYTHLDVYKRQPQNYIRLESAEDMEKMRKLLDNLEDNDDVQSVWHNWENEDEYEG